MCWVLGVKVDHLSLGSFQGGVQQGEFTSETKTVLIAMAPSVWLPLIMYVLVFMTGMDLADIYLRYLLLTILILSVPSHSDFKLGKVNTIVEELLGLLVGIVYSLVLGRDLYFIYTIVNISAIALKKEAVLLRQPLLKTLSRNNYQLINIVLLLATTPSMISTE
jgi:hypothetical protein